MNKQKMTRTTELLKGCEEEFEYTNDYAPHYIKCGNKFANTGIILCPSCKSELRGRLDALKEEVEFLENCIECETDCYHKDGHTINMTKLRERLASIQEEIKLIERKI